MSSKKYLIFLMFVASSAYADDSWRGGKDASDAQAPKLLLTANGCYWHSGERFCSSYCYVEINGKRYCNARERAAVPQGNPYLVRRSTVEEIYRRPRD